MIIEETQNQALINEILTHPDIYPTISADNSPDPMDFVPEINDHMYLIGYVDSVPMGCMIYHLNTNCSLWCHVQVLPEYRKAHAMDFGKKSLGWLFERFPVVEKVCAQIPTTYPNVLKFAKAQGFVEEGINTKSHMKDGIAHDQIYLGLERDKWVS